MRQNERKSKELSPERAADMNMMQDSLKWQCPNAKAQNKATLCQQLEKVRYRSEDYTAERERNNYTISPVFTSQAVAKNTNRHRICATGGADAVGVHQWSEIYVYKISGNKHLDGNKAPDSPFSCLLAAVLFCF